MHSIAYWLRGVILIKMLRKEFLFISAGLLSKLKIWLGTPIVRSPKRRLAAFFLVIFCKPFVAVLIDGIHCPHGVYLLLLTTPWKWVHSALN